MSGLGTFSGRLEEALRIRRIGKMYALAVLLGVDESAISRWRRGKAISTANLVKLCDALDLSVDWLLTGRGTMHARHSRDAQCQELLRSRLASLAPDEGERLAEIFHLMAALVERPSSSGRRGSEHRGRPCNPERP